MLNHRIITAVVLAVVVFGVIFCLPLQVFNAVTVLLMAAGVWELALMFWPQSRLQTQINSQLFYQLQSQSENPVTRLHRFLFLSVIVGVAIAGLLYSSFLAFPILVIGVIWWPVALLILVYYVRTEIGCHEWSAGVNNHECRKSFDNLLACNSLVKYIVGVCIFVPFAIAVNILQVQFGQLYLLYALFLICSNDIGAYFVGSFCGKYLLAPTISPKKTLEGLYGGIVLSCVVIICGGFLLKIHGIRWLLWITVGIVVGLWSVVGDLFESMLKRQAKVKDSGSLLPGHGGVYDRIDSFTAALPIFVLCLLLTDFN